MLHNLTISHVQIISCLIGSIIFVSLVLHALYIGILNITYISFNTIWSSAFKSINNFNEKALNDCEQNAQVFIYIYTLDGDEEL